VLAPLQAIERRMGQALQLPDPKVRLPPLIQALGAVDHDWPQPLPGCEGWPE
jgi:hypothetical protein